MNTIGRESKETPNWTKTQRNAIRVTYACVFSIRHRMRRSSVYASGGLRAQLRRRPVLPVAIRSDSGPDALPRRPVIPLRLAVFVHNQVGSLVVD